MFKKIFYILLIIFISNNVYADVIIEKFDEKIKFTDFGREVTIKIKVKIKAEKNVYYDEWKYIFDKKLNIEVSNAKVIGRKYKTFFGNNEVVFNFDKAMNGDIVEFEFSYIQFNDNNVNYSRHEYVGIPKFAKNANGKLEIEISDLLAVYSYNPNFKQNSNIYTWEGKVPKNGFFDYFYLTLRQAKWKINILNQIHSEEKFSKIDVITPTYLKNGNGIIESYNISTNYSDNFVKIHENDKDTRIDFYNINGNNVLIKLDAIIKIDFNDKIWIKLDPAKYLKIDENLANKLYNIVYNIQVDNKKQQPLYITIAEWVYNNMEYDSKYIGKDMTTLEILSKGAGVCSHYAKLYNDLLRASGIPSVVVSGISYDVKQKKFDDHAWNLVYYNGDWIFIDPTWGLYSGKVPISHIFLYFNERNVLDYTVYNVSTNDFQAEVKKNVKLLNE